MRVFENRNFRNEEEAVKVFVLFTSELSALRGVNALDGRLFGGRTYVIYLAYELTCSIKARFYDVDKFEAGDLNHSQVM